MRASVSRQKCEEGCRWCFMKSSQTLREATKPSPVRNVSCKTGRSCSIAFGIFRFQQYSSMQHIDSDVLKVVLNHVYTSMKTRVRYVAYGDGEQMLSIFYKDTYPFQQVSRAWNRHFCACKHGIIK